jgi:hypothetical protein
MTGGVAAQVQAAAVERLFSAAYVQAVATLVRMSGDITLAEDAVQDAFVVASGRWRTDGIHPALLGGSSQPHATVPSMISVVRPVVGHYMHNSALLGQPRTARASRSAARTDP